MIARVSCISSENSFRAEGFDIKTGSPISINFSPSDYGYSMPEVGCMVVCEGSKTTVKTALGILGNPDPGQDGGIANGDKLSVPGNLLSMNPGDSYLGKRGRIYLSDDVFIYSNSYRAKLMLSDDGVFDAKGYNWGIRTEDGLVGVYTSSQNKYSFGNSLTMSRYGVDTGETKLLFSSDGSADLMVRDGSETPCRATFGSTGDISLFSGGKDPGAPAMLTLRGDGSEAVLKSTTIKVQGIDISIVGKTTIAGALSVSGGLVVTGGAIGGPGGINVGGKITCTFPPEGTGAMANGATYTKLPIYVAGVKYYLVMVQ
jgi:hypothetical protein